ncbi:ATP-dependent RNA helicase HrpA [Phycisphaera mikurensis]|uniref:ATP-dependent RNA helicase HrpA n=1 Tax=Phycisphaera mikurensis (strain NBRC 102666 / KCTC 22515 / FYK2301M01) TaxID=1142394 RepID=I0IHM9_PHYMF|nr:ATP-dependent RNA helicase HrpA [Phycisphaera mikurensis]MBB6441012.1 ATP-dependent helicase HrpA [Phycisphaera mikurensis]BAM04767.1 ATP-dependent RNA helicase HrpA [Phycisphaera mikurensis NBRC 102666]
MSGPPEHPRPSDARRQDVPALRALWKKIQHAQSRNRPHDRDLARFEKRLAASVAAKAERAAAAPDVSYPADLPVSAEKDRIKELIARYQVAVLCGETGSGKSTQLPKILMELGHGSDGVIAHTQPRRLAARTLAQRVAAELSVPVGGVVGHSVRFEDRTGPQTRIRYLTDGLLLAELARDPDLLACDAVIVDEAHERSLNIDFLLGYLKRLLPRRPDLKLVITSATINTQLFAEHFRDEAGEPAPVIEVSGRTYPVEVRYAPPEDASDAAADRALLEAFDAAVRGTPGDVLVFLPTERAIGDAARLLRGHTQARSFPGGSVEVLPLYARLSNAEQQRVFSPSGPGRRVVLATNVAESSVTVPRITSVIDTGTARISRYSARARMQRLPIEPVSQASCRQRAGRCGRVAPGLCIRLYSEEDFDDRPAFEAPEVLRTSLASVILTMSSMGLGDPADFPFLEPPRPAAIREGRKTLHELGAAEKDGTLTELGRRMATLPVDPRVARMIFAGAEEGCLAEVLVIAAALEAQDPRLRPVEKQQAADQAHRPFVHPRSDFLTLLNLWDGIHREKDSLSGGAFKRWCSRTFLSHPKVREWAELHRQLVETARGAGLSPKRRTPGPEAVEKLGDAVTRALLAGLLSNVALREDGPAYKAAGAESGDRELFLWPGSALARAKPRWVVAAEVVSTTRQYARTCAQIDPRWIEDLAGDLVTQTHSNPRWEREAGGVFADEKVSFRGLVLVPKRRVKLSHVDPVQAREIFLHEALVGGDADLTAPFFLHNRELERGIEEEQARLRRVDLLADAKRRYRFYDERLPAEVTGVAELNRWLKRASEARRRRLFMAEADLREQEAEEDPGRPATIETGGLVLPVRYVHDASAEDDGATLEVPLAVLGRVGKERLDWGLPGQLEERLAAVIRSLPKPIRKTLAPAPDSARRAAARIRFGEGGFRAAAAEALGWVRGEALDPLLIDVAALDRHLRLGVAVLDDAGKELAQGRDLDALKEELAASAGRAVAGLADDRWIRDGLVSWSFGDLPETVDVAHAGVRLRCFPTLLDRGESVSLRAVETAAEAEATFPRGVLRLARLAVRRDLVKRVEGARGAQPLALIASTLPGGAAALQRDLADAASARVFVPLIEAHPSRSAAAFEALVEAGRGDLAGAASEATAEAAAALGQGHALRLELERLARRCPPGWETAVRQSREQLEDLLRPRFVATTPAGRLRHLGRYLAASRERLAALARGKLAKDRPLADAFDRRMGPLRARLSEAGGSAALESSPELAAYRWMLEEWRVALFAAGLGTSQPVSEKRLEKQAAKADREARGG